jgi:molecular chaperone GrpE (heat shock protein)
MMVLNAVANVKNVLKRMLQNAATKDDYSQVHTLVDMLQVLNEIEMTLKGDGR